MIIDDINKANIQAMKDKDSEARVALGVLKNKYMLAKIEKRAVNSELAESDVVAIVMKAIKELTEEAENYEKAGNIDQQQKVLYQKKVVEQFLPKLMSEDEIKAEVEKITDKSLPSIMKHFKANFAGKVDMLMVKNIATNL